jgi:hypothetical protein
MIKKLLLLIILLAAAVYFVGSSVLNKGIQTGVETFGPKVTQTAVQLDAVNLSILSGKGTLTGLNVGNPEGFKSEHIFALGQIDVEVEPGSVFSDKIIINKIHIQQPEISYEKTLSGSNIKTLLKNIEAFSGPAEASPETEAPAEAGAQKQVVIKQLIIEDGSIYVGLLGVGSKVPLPRIEMNNLGDDGNKQSIAETINLVLTEVLKSIGPAIAGAGDLLQQGGTAMLDTAKQQGIDKVSEAADDAVKQASEKVGEAADAAVNKASEGLKSLFGK